jgi:hypothetical protein
MTLTDFLSKFPNAKKRGRFHYVNCPGRDDRNPSLSVWEENGWIKMRDWGGQMTDQDVCAALGIENRDLRTGAPEEENYPYRDASGNPLFSKVRRPHPSKGKTFAQIGANGQRDLSHLNGQSKTLYRLQEVRKGVGLERTIYICEGEKAVDAIRAEKGVATCQPSGADPEGRNWLPKHTEEFKGANVVIVADRDDVGERYATAVWNAVRKVAKSCRVVRSKTTNPKDDAFDHLCAGFGLEDFEPALDLMVEPDIEDLYAALGIVQLSTVPTSEVEWLWYPYIPLKYCTLIDGDGDLGKSYMACGIAACLSNGYLPDGKPLRGGPAKVLLLMSEDEADDTIVPRIESFGGNAANIMHVRSLFALDEKGLEKLDRMIQAVEPLVVVIDPLLGYCGAAVNINLANEMRPILDALKQLATKHRCAILNIRHEGKGASDKKAGRARHHGGLGTVDIRNAHRSQLVVDWHPNVKGLRVIMHKKHNLSEEGKTFGYEFRDNKFCWRWDVPEGEHIKVTGTKQQDAIDLIYQTCSGVWVPSAEVEALASISQISVGTLRLARTHLSQIGALETKQIDRVWHMKVKPKPEAEEEDPYVDP